MSTIPVSMRVEESLWEDVRQRASLQRVTVTAYVQSLIIEGLRMRDVPGIVFRDGPTGRRAALVDGPDVWEIITALRMAESGDEGAVQEVAADLRLPVSSVETALSYYSRFPDEVDERIAFVEKEADTARAASEKRQSILSPISPTPDLTTMSGSVFHALRSESSSSKSR